MGSIGRLSACPEFEPLMWASLPAERTRAPRGGGRPEELALCRQRQGRGARRGALQPGPDVQAPRSGPVGLPTRHDRAPGRGAGERDPGVHAAPLEAHAPCDRVYARTAQAGRVAPQDGGPSAPPPAAPAHPRTVPPAGIVDRRALTAARRRQGRARKPAAEGADRRDERGTALGVGYRERDPHPASLRPVYLGVSPRSTPSPTASRSPAEPSCRRRRAGRGADGESLRRQRVETASMRAPSSLTPALFSGVVPLHLNGIWVDLRCHSSVSFDLRSASNASGSQRCGEIAHCGMLILNPVSRHRL